MGLVYLIRHPAPEIRPDTPAVEWTLSEVGYRQIHRLLQEPWWQDIKQLYSSIEAKALVVATSASERFGIPYSSHSELAELHRPADFVPDFRERIMQAFKTPEVAFLGGESIAAAQSRAWCFLQQVVGQGPLPSAVVSHGIVLSAVRALLLRRDFIDPLEWAQLPFCAVAEIDTDDWSIRQDFASLSF